MESDLDKAGTTRERIAINIIDAAGNSDFGEVSALLKGVRPNAEKGIGDCEAGQAWLDLESPTPNACHLQAIDRIGNGHRSA